MLYQKIIPFLFRCTGDFIWCILILLMWEAGKNSFCFLLNISCYLNVSTVQPSQAEVHSWLCPCSENIPYFLSFLIIILSLESCHMELYQLCKSTFHFIIVPMCEEASCCPEQSTCFFTTLKKIGMIHQPRCLISSLCSMDTLISTSSPFPSSAHLFPASVPSFLILLMHTETLSFYPVTA